MHTFVAMHKGRCFYMGTFHKNPVYNNIQALCDNHTPRTSFSKMCVDLGISKSLGTKLKDDPDRSINGETAKKIADYFGVSIDLVLGKEQKEKPTSLGGELDYSDAEILAAIQKADESTKEAIRLILKLR